MKGPTCKRSVRWKDGNLVLLTKVTSQRKSKTTYKDCHEGDRHHDVVVSHRSFLHYLEIGNWCLLIDESRRDTPLKMKFLRANFSLKPKQNEDEWSVMIHIKLMKIKTQSYDELPLDERQKAEFPATSPFSFRSRSFCSWSWCSTKTTLEFIAAHVSCKKAILRWWRLSSEKRTRWRSTIRLTVSRFP